MGCEPVYGAPVEPRPVYPLAVVTSSAPSKGAVLTVEEHEELKAKKVAIALAGRKFSDIAEEVRNQLRAYKWGSKEDRAAINLVVGRVQEDKRGRFNKEITFSVPSTSLTPELHMLQFGVDGYSRSYRGEWRYQTGADNLIRAWCSDWEFDVTRRDGKDHYRIRTRNEFVGGLKITAAGASYLIYTHGDAVVSKAEPPPAVAATTVKSDPPSGLSFPSVKAKDDEQKKLDELARREKALQQKEAEFAQRVKAKEEELANKIKAKEEEFARRTKALEVQEQTFQKRQIALERAEAGVKETRGKLDLEQAALSLRSTALDKRESDLNGLAATLDTRAQKLRNDEEALTLRSDQLTALAKALDGTKLSQVEEGKRLSARKLDLDALAAAVLKDQQEGTRARAANAELKDSLEAGVKKNKDDAAALASQKKELAERSAELDTTAERLRVEDESLKKQKLELARRTDLADKDKEAAAEKIKEQERLLAKENKELGKERERLKSLETSLEDQKAALAKETLRLEELKTGLAARGGTLDTLEARLKAQELSLAALQTKLDKAQAALAREKKGPDELKITAPEPVIAAPPALTWTAPAADRGIKPARDPKITVPDWVRLVTTVDFDIPRLEKESPDPGFTEFLNGGKSTTAEDKWYQKDISMAYKPFMAVRDELNAACCMIAKLGEKYKGGLNWDAEDRESALTTLDTALKAYDIAVKGGGLEEESKHGTAEKISSILERVTRLRAIPSADRKDFDTSQLSFLEGRLVRMQEFDSWLSRMKLHVDVLRTAAASEDSDLLKALHSDDVTTPAPAPAVAAATLKPALEGLFTTNGRPADFTRARAEFRRIGSAAGTDAAAVRKVLGGEDQLDIIEKNLKLAKASLQDDGYKKSQEAAAFQQKGSEVYDLLTSGKPIETRVRELEAHAKAVLGKSPFGTGAAKMVDSFIDAPDQVSRSKAFWTMMKPFMEKVEADFIGERQAAEADLDAALKAVGRGRQTLAAEKLTRATDAAYIAFAGSHAHFREVFEGLEKDAQDALRKDVKSKQAEALKAVNAELELLKPLVTKDKGPQETAFNRRNAVLEKRKLDIENWKEE